MEKSTRVGNGGHGRHVTTAIDFWRRLSKKQKWMAALAAILLLLVVGPVVHLVALLLVGIWQLVGTLLNSNVGFIAAQEGVQFAKTHMHAGGSDPAFKFSVNRRMGSSEATRQMVLARAQLELDDLTGLAEAKRQIGRLANVITVSRRRAADVSPHSSLNFLFVGNPGTGKTTVARIFGDMLFGLGVLRSGHLVEVDRGGLVAGYVGQTAIKTAAALEAARDGVLFVDEAYSLASSDSGVNADIASEAVSTILKFIEDKRGELCVILAGYEDKIRELVESNPGLKLRFSRTVRFEDYDAESLHAIFVGFCTDEKLLLDASADRAVQAVFTFLVQRGATISGNGRLARNLYERCKETQADRIMKGRPAVQSLLGEITAEDVKVAAEEIAKELKPFGIPRYPPGDHR